MTHNFQTFPELTNSQMQMYYFDSPHKQITEDFQALVTKVHDGDTITLRWKERDFDFPLRLSNIAAPELSEPEGNASQSWLEAQLLNQDVDIVINPKNRVEKWGRLLGNVICRGLNVGEQSIFTGHSVSWTQRNDGKITDFSKEMNKKWF